uniref:Uncharacterized protein n=1 Tax=viral metagenome TaxID=1070528 RepID=A0A6H1ZUE1_9ZZZZ
MPVIPVYKLDILPRLKSGDSYGVPVKGSLRWVPGLSALLRCSYLPRRYFPPIRR